METGTARSSPADPKPQEAPRRPTSSGSWKSEQAAPNPFPSASSTPSSSTSRASQPCSSDNQTFRHASHDHHSSPKSHSTKPSSAGSSGGSHRSRTRTSKSYDNIRNPSRSPSPGQASPSSADRFHTSRTSDAPSHSKSHENLRDCPRNSHESGQVHPSTAHGSKPEASIGSKNNHTTQEAGPTFNSPKGGSRGFGDAKSWRSRSDKLSQPVIPRTTSKLHKRSPLGLGE
jgi:hypothetical protein